MTQERDQSAFLEDLAIELRAAQRRLDALERRDLEAALGIGTAAREGGPLGMPTPTLAAGPVAPATVLAPGSVVPDAIAPAAINSVTPFASGIRPVVIVGALPALPDAAYPVGSVVVLTTNGKLYRNVANAWTAAVAGADVSGQVASALAAVTAASASVADAVAAAGITGQIASTQITDGAISTPKLAAAAVTAAKIGAGEVIAGKLATDSVVAANIQAGAVTTAKMTAGSIDGDRIAAGTLDASKIIADSITAGQIAAGGIGASEIAAGAVSADKIAAGAVRVGNLASQIPGANLVANGSFDIVGSGYNVNPGTGVGDPLTTANVASMLPGWTAVDVPGSGGSPSVNVADTTPGHGQYRLGIQAGTTIGTGRLWSDYVPVVPGQTLKGSMLLRGSGVNVGTANGALWCRWYKADKTVSATTETAIIPNYNVGPSGTWVRREGSVTVPADAYFMRVTVVLSSSSSSGVFIAYDDVRVFAPADLTNSTGEVLIDSTGLAVTNGKISVSNATDGTVIDSGVVRQVKNSATEVVINSTGLAITNGKITVTNAGSTVVIDGTSNMFKIKATGTQSRAFPANGTSSTVSAVLAGTGNTMLMALFQGTPDGSLSTKPRYGDSNFLTILSDGKCYSRSFGFTDINAGTDNRVSLTAESTIVNPGTTAWQRYYLLVEAGI